MWKNLWKMDDKMLLKRKSKIDEISNVRFVNGSVSLGDVSLNVHCFEVDGVLIDTGSQSLAKELRHFFSETDIDQVLITHDHEDHTGGAAYLQKEYNLPIHIHSTRVDHCTKKADYPFYRKLFWGKRRPFKAKPIGQTFHSLNALWDVIETPGHTKDHLSFLNQETGQLFPGDLYVHPKMKVVLRDEDIPAIIRSLEHVLTYEFGELYCCHAGYVKDGRQALMNKLEYLKELEEKVLSLHRQGHSEKEIQAIIFKKKYPITFFSSGEWDSLHIITSILRRCS